MKLEGITRDDLIVNSLTKKTYDTAMNYLAECALIAHKHGADEKKQREAITLLVNSLDLNGFYAVTEYMVTAYAADQIMEAVKEG